MSIATAIQSAQQKVANAYTAVSSKGGTLPSIQDLSNLPTAINSISGGGGSNPFGILFQGEYDAQGNYTMPYDLTYTGNISFNGIKNISNISTASGGAFASYLYHQANQAGRLKCRLISGTVSFPDLETVNNASCFSSFCNGQTQITSVSFPKLTTVSGSGCFNYAFEGCTSLVSIYFNSLTSNLSFSNALNRVTGCVVHLPTNYAGTCNLGGTSTQYVKDL